MSMYLSIALDIAKRIINGEFSVGSRISGRTLLASHYNVSSETIRKAVALLKEASVVTVSQGKEVKVTSVEQACLFIEHNNNMQSVYSLKQEIELLLEQKKRIDAQLEHVLNEIINYSDRLKNLSPYNPIEITVPEESHIVGQTVAAIKFWQHTGATVVAIRRDTNLIISPGPLAVIESNDKLVVVGKPEILQQVNDYINKAVNQEQ